MKTVGHVRHPISHSHLLESVVFFTRTIHNKIQKHDLHTSQRLAGTQRNIGSAVEMKVWSHGKPCSYVVVRTFLFTESDLHHTGFPSKTSPVQEAAAVVRICGSHAHCSMIWDLPYSPTLSLKMGHEACALLFPSNRKQTSLGATSHMSE